MPRKKKIRTPEEQAKHDKFWSRYKTHDGPRGNADEWKQAASGQSVQEIKAKADADLSLLGLIEMPVSMNELNVARRKAMAKAHPDADGSHDMAVEINTAYQNLKIKVQKKT